MSAIYRVARRHFIQLTGVAAAGATLGACVTPPLPAEAPVSGPAEALDRLLAGNARFVANRSVALNESPARRAEVAQGQHPFATILSCVDSRVPPELVFDRGFGDLFVIRIAGQVIDSAVLGSIEFGAAELDIPLILVLGHEKCGAVKATIETLEKHAEAPGSIATLVTAIRPAVEKAQAEGGDLLAHAVDANIRQGVALLQESPVLADLLAQSKIQIVGGRYDLDTGAVALLTA